MTILFKTQVVRPKRTTTHRVGTRQTQRSEIVQLSIFDSGAGFFLFQEDNGGVVFDTWHETVDQAKSQADYEYEITGWVAPTSERTVLGWGIYPWFAEHGANLIHPDDRTAFEAMHPNGRVFQHIGNEAGYMVLAYGPPTFRVKPELFSSVPPQAFPIGTAVKIVEKKIEGVVEHIFWHFRDDRAFYLLRYNGKKHSRRYWESELAPWSLSDHPFR